MRKRLFSKGVEWLWIDEIDCHPETFTFPPLFVKAGAIIPMGPEMLFVDEKKADPLTLDVYPHGSTSYAIYEDDGKTRDYKKGVFATTRIAWQQEQGKVRVTLNEREGKYSPGAKTVMLQISASKEPVRVEKGGAVLTKKATLEAPGKVATGWTYGKEPETGSQRVWVKFPSSGKLAVIDVK